MVLKKPYIKLVGDDDNKVPSVQKFEERFTEDDLVLDCITGKKENDNKPSFNTEEDGDGEDDSMSWLNAL